MVLWSLVGIYLLLTLKITPFEAFLISLLNLMLRSALDAKFEGDAICFHGADILPTFIWNLGEWNRIYFDRRMKKLSNVDARIHYCKLDSGVSLNGIVSLESIWVLEEWWMPTSDKAPLPMWLHFPGVLLQCILENISLSAEVDFCFG